MDQQTVPDITNGDVLKGKKPRWKAPTVKEVYADQSDEAKNEIIAYLKRFGYMQEQTLDKAKDLSTGLATLQSFAGLKKTGTYDQATEALINQPRCGISDKQSGTVLQFVAQGSKWNHTNITYRFENFTPDLTPAQVRTTIQGALGRWAAVTPLSFSEVTTSEDITIRFVTGNHGDGYPFDGPGNVLAHAFYPNQVLTGDTHFDEDETWSEFSLAQVALHEFGHALGLSHSTVSDAVMWPYYDGGHPELHEDDMAGIHSIYGWRDPRWEQLDHSSETTSILAVSNELYKLHKTGLVWRYIGPPFTGWQLISNDPNTIQLAAGVGGELYQRRSNGDIARYNGNPLDWSLIDANPDSVDIATGGNQLYQRHKEGAIYRYAGPGATPAWKLIDDNPRSEQITAAEGGLYQRHNNGDLWRYVGPGINWELLENHSAPGQIVAAGDKLYQLNGHDIWEWSFAGATTRAQKLDGNPATVGIYARGKHMYQIHDSGRILRYTGTPFSGWEVLDEFAGTKEVVGNENGDVFQRHADGDIWRLVS